MVNYDILVKTQTTPNPQALKFVVNAPIKMTGKATFANSEEAGSLRLAMDLFSVKGVEQLHMFENVVTVTFGEEFSEDDIVANVTSVLQTRLPVHDPNFQLEKEKVRIREKRSPEIEQIEEILDRTIRPGLQADGGDLDIMDLKDNVLTVAYQGACGSCPSAMYGTLDAIHSILRAEYSADLQIQIDQEI